MAGDKEVGVISSTCLKSAWTKEDILQTQLAPKNALRKSKDSKSGLKGGKGGLKIQGQAKILQLEAKDVHRWWPKEKTIIKQPRRLQK